VARAGKPAGRSSTVAVTALHPHLSFILTTAGVSLDSAIDWPDGAQVEGAPVKGCR